MIDREKVITALECCKDVHQSGRWASGCISCGYSDKHRPDCFLRLADDAVEQLKEQEPKLPVHIHQEYKEHAWALNKDGTVDRSYYESGYCNGPFCKRCGHFFCVHCWPEGWNEPCVIDVDLCPKCERPIENGDKFCHDCGQAVKWDD